MKITNIDTQQILYSGEVGYVIITKEKHTIKVEVGIMVDIYDFDKKVCGPPFLVARLSNNADMQLLETFAETVCREITRVRMFDTGTDILQYDYFFGKKSYLSSTFNIEDTFIFCLKCDYALLTLLKEVGTIDLVNSYVSSALDIYEYQGDIKITSPNDSEIIPVILVDKEPKEV